MKLLEGILMLERVADQYEESGRPYCVAAARLGIEELKREHNVRSGFYPDDWQLLSGGAVKFNVRKRKGFLSLLAGLVVDCVSVCISFSLVVLWVIGLVMRMFRFCFCRGGNCE